MEMKARRNGTTPPGMTIPRVSDPGTRPNNITRHFSGADNITRSKWRFASWNDDGTELGNGGLDAEKTIGHFVRSGDEIEKHH